MQLFDGQVRGRKDTVFTKLLDSLPQVGEEEQERLAQPITLQEVQRAIEYLSIT